MLALFCALAGCAPGPDLDASRRFQEAQEVFSRAAQPEEFLRAAAIYQELLETGLECGAVLYNQGNAYMRAGRRGLAIAAYRRALRYRPRDPYLDANLRAALGGGAGGSGPAGIADAAARRPLVEYVLFWQRWLSEPEKFSLAALAGALALALGLVALFAANGVPWRRAAAGFLLATLLVAVSAALDLYRYRWIRHGVVTAQEVLARKGNGASYEPAFNQALPEGTEFVMGEQRGDWVLVRLAGDLEGWIPADAAVLY
ncbi:MAG: tetratricopeptide repeat protein [Planctomycetes bacterium]|nr:tetratricopeptide repeat protein [Planctomycetota bacterium]